MKGIERRFPVSGFWFPQSTSRALEASVSVFRFPQSKAHGVFREVRDAEGDGGCGQGFVECHHSGAVVGADREVKCVAGAQARLVLIGKARGCAEISARNRHNDKTFLNQTRELCQAIGAMLGLNFSVAQFQGLRT